MKRELLLVTLMFVSVSVWADTSFKHWPLKGSSETDAPVVAAYQEQCEAWYQQMSDTEKALVPEYLKSCTSDMPKLWPVGYDESDS